MIVPTSSAEAYLRTIGVTSDIYVQATGIDFEAFQKREGEMEKSDDLRARQGLSPEDTVLLTVSRLSREKNLDFLIEGMARLRSQTKLPFKCLIIGEGAERAHLQERIEKLGLARQVSLIGSVPPEEMVDYYRLGDVFLFASRSETQGMVILEAMAAGLPVVAVRSSGIDDIVENRINGFKTPADLSRWTESLQIVLEDRQLRRNMSREALEKAREYSISNFAGHVSDIYARVLAAAGGRGR